MSEARGNDEHAPRRSIAATLAVAAALCLVAVTGPVAHLWYRPAADRWLLVGAGVVFALVAVVEGRFRWIAGAIVLGAALPIAHRGIGAMPVVVVAATTAVAAFAIRSAPGRSSPPSVAGLSLAVAAGATWWAWARVAISFALLAASLLCSWWSGRPASPVARVDAAVASWGRERTRSLVPSITRSRVAVVALSVAVLVLALALSDGARRPRARAAAPRTTTTSVAPPPVTDLTTLPAATGQPWFAEVLAEHSRLPIVTDPDGSYGMGDFASLYTNVTNGERRTAPPILCDCRLPVVWLVGGSAVFGIGQRDSGTVASQLVAAAADRGRGLVVRNLSVSGWTFWQAYEGVVQRLGSDEERPDAVVFLDGFNDIAQTLVQTVANGGPPDWSKPVVFDEAARSSTHGAAYSSDAIDSALDAAGGAPALGRRAARRYLELRETVERRLAAEDVRALFTFQPDALAGDSQRAAGTAADTVLPRELVEPARVVLDAAVDALPAADRRSRGLFADERQPVFYDLVNFNETGAKAVARSLERQLRAALPEPAAPRQPNFVSIGRPAADPLAGTKLRARRLATVEEPTVSAARAGTSDLYVGERGGRVRRLVSREGGRFEVAATPVLDLSSETASDGLNQGLLGMAFSPDGRQLFVYRSDLERSTRLERFDLVGDAAEMSTRTELLVIPIPRDDHAGGSLRWGPDGLLWLAVGDGGGIGDPDGNGQKAEGLLGKVLRVSPDGSGSPSVAATGLRNPWRTSFDRLTGDLWIGDVGQQHAEELDVLPAGTMTTVNFGWSGFEGTQVLVPEQVSPSAVPPIFEYGHHGDCDAIVGGVVYRGAAIPSLEGKYVFADLCHGGLRALDIGPGRATKLWRLGVDPEHVVSIDEDASGELVLTSMDGGVYRLEAT